MHSISGAFEDLSHALRVLLEADWRAKAGGLLQLDRAEAVGNIESALAGVFNAFHSLYDITNKTSELQIDWYAKPELLAILTLRNARHHNHANKVRTLYTYYIQESESIGRMETYVLLDFPAAEESSDTFDVFISWQDLKTLLALPSSRTRIRSANVPVIQEYLGSSRYARYAEAYGLSEDRVFLNVIPLICNAAAVLVPEIASYINPASTESKTYLHLFKDMPLADTCRPEVNCGPIAYAR